MLTGGVIVLIDRPAGSDILDLPSITPKDCVLSWSWVKKAYKGEVVNISFRAVLAWAVMTDFRESLLLLREVNGGLGGCQGKTPSICFVKCMAVLADVSVCNLHMLRPTSETRNCKDNNGGAQNGSFDPFEGTPCLKFLRPLVLRGAFGGVGV